MKKYLLTLISISALILLVSFSAVATEELATGSIELGGSIQYEPFVHSDSEAELFGETIEDVILEGLINVDEQINIQKFGYKISEANTILNILSRIVYSNYEVYYAETGFTYSYSLSSGVITTISPYYTTTNINEIKKYRSLIENRIDEIFSYTNDDMSKLQKLLTVYDRLILESEYDTTLTKRTIKDILVDGTAVCAGYTTALASFARVLDIPFEFIQSNQMNHVWNLFFIDGNWYHFDATFDDPISDTYSRVNHKNFLKSDDWMINETNHYGFSQTGADNTEYDDKFWTYSNSSIITVGDDMYYINGNSGTYSLYCYNTTEDSYTAVYTFKDKWHTTPGGSRYWVEAYTGLCYYDGLLYFNDSSSIYSIETDGSDLTKIYTIDDSYNNSIYGCFLDDNLIRFGMGPKAAPNSSKPLDRLYIEIEEDKEDDDEPKFIKGDINGDTSVDVADALLLLQYSMFPELYPIDYEGNIDFTDDGDIDVADAILLLQYSMFPDLYPLGGDNDENSDDKEDIPEDALFYLSGETYTGYEEVWGDNCFGIEVVNNPDNKKDLVLYLETNVTEKQAWNYFWHRCNWVPGQSYLITYSARPGNDAFGNPVVQGSFGTCVRTNAKDKGVGSIIADGGTWKNVAIIYTIPEDIDLSKDMRFGIFASPIEVPGYDHNLAWSFYLDDICIVPYYGDQKDGIVK